MYQKISAIVNNIDAIGFLSEHYSKNVENFSNMEQIIERPNGKHLSTKIVKPRSD